MIIITSKKEGFRRCGVAHPTTPTGYADDRFNPEQLKALHKEPMLVVVELQKAEPEEAAVVAPEGAPQKTIPETQEVVPTESQIAENGEGISDNTGNPADAADETVAQEESTEADLAAKPKTASEKIAIVREVATLEELDKLAEGETRKTVLEAIEARRAELGA